MRYLKLVVLILVAQAAGAATMQVDFKMSTSAQDLQYLQVQLEELLRPAGYDLVRESIQMSDASGGGAGQQRNGLTEYPYVNFQFEDSNRAIRFVTFDLRARASQEIFTGSVYLVVARTDEKNQPKVALSQPQLGLHPYWRRHFYMALAIEPRDEAFLLPVRPVNMHLTLKPDATFEKLQSPAWAIPRLYAKVSTTAQDVIYLQKALTQILEPHGYQLNLESVDIATRVVVGTSPGFPPVEVVVEGRTHALRSVQFVAQKENQLSSGSVILVAAKSDPFGRPLVSGNSQWSTFSSQSGEGVIWLGISNGVSQDSFQLEVRPTNLSLREMISCESLLQRRAS